MGFYTDKKVLVTGGTGMIGRHLVDMLVLAGADVTVASIDKDVTNSNPKVTYKYLDLRYLGSCETVCMGIDTVFHLAGVKGSPAMTASKPASFFTNTLMFNTNMLEAARRAGVARYLYTSSVGVYAPAVLFEEDSVWQTAPSNNDRFAGWAKRIGELQADAYRIQYGSPIISIVRPANVYGPFDNFDLETGMVIPSLIRRVVAQESPLMVWGDGSPVRDFVYAGDVARGMLMAVQNGIIYPMNLGSGDGVSIKNLVQTILKFANYEVTVQYQIGKPAGDAVRLMDTKRAQSLMGWYPKIGLEEGIRETMRWFRQNSEVAGRYNAFKEKV